MSATLKNVVVVGGSYVGMNMTKKLASTLPSNYRVLLVEPHSHFHHLFAFPRFAAVPGHEHKAFIPYTGTFAAFAEPHQHALVRAKALQVHPNKLTLDREWQGSKDLAFEYLILATGTRLQPPGTLEQEDKRDGVKFFQRYQERIKNANKICIIGAGAVGVQMATDIKDYYPEKSVTLVHSRPHTMSRFHPKLHDLVAARCQEMGITLLTGSRAVIPKEGFPTGESEIEVQFESGGSVKTDFAILATGQIPNTEPLAHLSPSPIATNGFLSVRPTLQLTPPNLSHIFAIGDVADSGAPKAARPATQQVAIVASNLASLIEGNPDSLENLRIEPAAIHLTLGLKHNFVFRNPGAPGEDPLVLPRPEGAEDMGVGRRWSMMGVKIEQPNDYHL